LTLADLKRKFILQKLPILLICMKLQIATREADAHFLLSELIFRLF
jgi:hypothetical protein